MKDFLTLGEAAGHLGVSPVTLRIQIRNKKLRAVRYGNQWFVPKDAIREYAERFQNRDLDDSLLADIYERFIEDHSKDTVDDVLFRFEKTERMAKFRKGLFEIAANARHEQIRQGLCHWAKEKGFPNPRGPFEVTKQVNPDVFDSLSTKSGHHFLVCDAKNTERPGDEATRIRLHRYFHVMELVASRIETPVVLTFATGYGRKNLHSEWEAFLKEMAEHFGYSGGVAYSEVIDKERSLYVTFMRFEM
ncbi:MAG: helix-turn-helix domain-containing protein [Myxococcales bacterium]|nr:helix-turn-helix domain-containing protein [Myxococcales bacterium]